MKSMDFTAQKILTLRDVQAAHAAGATSLEIGDGCPITPSARDFLQQHEIAVRDLSPEKKNGKANGVALNAPKQVLSEAEKIFRSPEAEVIKKEICAVGKKLWTRMYVDGNGGNISYRIGPNHVLCTPTLTSKADLTPADLCMVDLEGTQIAGTKPRTSEILLHLEIYKAVPEAKAAVHCHPPHATAYAITGRVPPNRVIPEFEVFVGKVAISPYETPGTTKFAQTVIPFVKEHNTVLLANHGIICWADTVTHAEWYVEVVDTYCWTLMLATQMGVPLSYISEDKETDLLSIKKTLGLPDARFAPGMKECQLRDLDMPEIALLPNTCSQPSSEELSKSDVETLIKSVTDAVMATLNGG